MKKRVIILYIFILSICLVSAVHEISSPSFSVEVGASTLYNLTINNTDLGQNANITQVSITMPSSFTFVEGSNGTDSLSVFTNTSTTLSWTNSTEYLINGSEWKNFWFNTIPATPGNYNLTIITTNGTGSFSSNISVEVDDSTSPSINFVSPTPTSNSNLSQSHIAVNVTATDNVAINTIIVYLYNSTNLVSSKTSSTSPFFENFTGLDYGTYHINATVNDTSGNTDSTSTRTIILNAIVSPCVPDWHCTNWSECINAIKIRSCVDFNTCGDNSTKPAENQSCDCVPDWYCAEWQPEKCPKNETQTRTCNDLNDCGTDEGKSDETKSCIPDSRANFLFIFIVIIIIIIIITVIILIIGLQKRIKPPIGDINPKPLGIPSKPL